MPLLLLRSAQSPGGPGGGGGRLDRAIELNPEYAYAYSNRGNARSAQGDLAGARADYERALAIFEASDDPRAETVRQILADLDE